MKFALTFLLAMILLASPALAQDFVEAPAKPAAAKPAPTATPATPAATPAAPAVTDGVKTEPADGATEKDDKVIDEKIDEDVNEEEKKVAEEENGLSGWMFPLLLVGAFVLMMVMSSKGRKKQAAKRKQMLDEMKKGDRVVSIGGIIGTAIDVRDDEVVVQIAEGTRMKFIRSAIARVGDDAKQEAEADQNEKK